MEANGLFDVLRCACLLSSASSRSRCPLKLLPVSLASVRDGHAAARAAFAVLLHDLALSSMRACENKCTCSSLPLYRQRAAAIGTRVVPLACRPRERGPARENPSLRPSLSLGDTTVKTTETPGCLSHAITHACTHTHTHTLTHTHTHTGTHTHKRKCGSLSAQRWERVASTDVTRSS
jgi:hypothetical protein